MKPVKSYEEGIVALASLLALSPEDRLVPEERCEHRLKVSVNDRQYVCVLCRKLLDEDAPYGISVTGSKTSNTMIATDPTESFGVAEQEKKNGR